MPADELYRRPAALLIRAIPLVAAETCFALKGGTAINLFVRNMPFKLWRQVIRAIGC
jgi:hypothetical protein